MKQKESGDVDPASESPDEAAEAEASAPSTDEEAGGAEIDAPTSGEAAGGAPSDDTDTPVEGIEIPPKRAHGRAVPAIAAVASAALVGVGSWFGLSLIDSQDSGAIPAPDSTTSPEPGVSPTSSEDPRPPNRPGGPWTVDWAAEVVQDTIPYSPGYLDAPAVFDDGLDHSDLPPLTERVSVHYPEAHEMTEEIWDAIGPGWYFATYFHNEWGYYDLELLESEPGVFFLVSSEGVRFRLPDPPSGDRTNPTYSVQYVNVHERWAITGVYEAGTEDPGYTIRWDMETGETLSTYANGYEDEGTGNLLTVIAPLAGGAELRHYKTRGGDPLPSDGLYSWTLDGGEVPVAVPEDLDLANLHLSDVASPDGAFVFGWTTTGDPYEEILLDRTYVFDLKSGELHEVVLGLPGQCTYPNMFGLGSDYVALGCNLMVSGESTWTVLNAPLDGSLATEADWAYGWDYLWEIMGFAIHTEQGTDGGGWNRIDDVSGGSPTVVYDFLAEDDPRSAEVFTPLALGDGRFAFVSWGWGRPILYDRESGLSFVPEPYWLPDTGASNAIRSVWFVQAGPEETE